MHFAYIEIWNLWDVCVKLALCRRELGRQRSSIELDTVSVKPGEMAALEDAVNDRIRAHVPVNVRLLSIEDPDVEKVCVLCKVRLSLLGGTD